MLVIAVSAVAASACLVMVWSGFATPASLAWRLAGIVVGAVVGAWASEYFASLAQASRPERRPLPLAAAMGSFMAAMTLAMACVTAGTRLEGLTLLWQGPFMFGMMLAMGAAQRREGPSLHCPACDYELAQAQAAAAAAGPGVREGPGAGAQAGEAPPAGASGQGPPSRCPECGNEWLGKLNEGRRSPAPRQIALGAALAVFFGVVLNPVFYIDLVAPYLPTGALYGVMYASPDGPLPAWAELSTRPLSPPAVRAMAERVIALRARRPWSAVPASMWFESAMGAGPLVAAPRPPAGTPPPPPPPPAMPADLVERYYREAVLITLQAPARGRVGKRFAVALRVLSGADGPRSHMAVAFGGYRINGGPVMSRREEPLWGFQICPSPMSPSKDIFINEFIPDRVGPLRVTAVYWVICQPAFASEVQWRGDELATPPSAAWFEKVELEAVVDVRE